jgi:hypothetical protein
MVISTQHRLYIQVAERVRHMYGVIGLDPTAAYHTVAHNVYQPVHQQCDPKRSFIRRGIRRSV